LKDIAAMTRTSPMRTALATIALMGAATSVPAWADESAPPVVHRTASVDGLSIFYREAGPPDAPAVLLLHGFPSSSFMYRDLMRPLARRYRVIAPDYPGFGQSAFPPASRYSYTFEQLARTMDRFTEVVGARRYALYIQDYGAPIGLRMALAYPERVTALIVQNGNAYAEGLSSGWDPLRAYWQAPTPRNREGLRGWLTAEGIRQQYVAGVPEHLLERFSPDTWTLDWSLLQRPGNIDVQLDLFGDYQHNVALYPRFQQMFRERQFPTLIVWGRHDVFFTIAGAQAYRRDLPKAELHLLDAGHFALETHAADIAAAMLEFLARQ
jgi:pimeloyl-ACP methyl ester carboxylesterase